MKKLFLLFAFVFCFSQVHLKAQIIVKKKVIESTTNRADQKVDEGINKGLDKVEEGVKNVFKKKKNPAGDQKDVTTPEGTKEENAQEAEVKPIATSQGLASYSKFDFIPGQKVIFYDDFTQDKVGDFPALWFSNGSGEVVTLNNFPGNWLHITGEGCYFPERELLLTENFTAEFDMIIDSKEGTSFDIGFYVVSGNVKDPQEGGAIPGKAGAKTNLNFNGISLAGYKDGEYAGEGNGENTFALDQKIHFSYWIQKQRMRIYVNEKKVVDAPRILPAGFKFNILRFEVGESKPYIANFRVAVGAPDTRNKLITEGKLVTYGIYFDVNSDKVKPESYGTLKDIATVLNEVPDVKVKIFGHTDSDGDDAKNLDLSKRRAASVKAELAKSFGVKADRLETDGLGESKPVAPNDTPANKALNRRVEFIKL